MEVVLNSTTPPRISGIPDHTSLTRDTTTSTHPPTNPASDPSTTAMANADDTTMAAIDSDVRVPCIVIAR